MLASPTVLCIDDEENGLKMRKWLLEAEGFQVLTALDGPSGIELFKTHSVDAAIIDYSMPVMDGIAVAATSRACHHAVRIPGTGGGK
jgi:CheY-like chemotaxis protein